MMLHPESPHNYTTVNVVPIGACYFSLLDHKIQKNYFFVIIRGNLHPFVWGTDKCRDEKFLKCFLKMFKKFSFFGEFPWREIFLSLPPCVTKWSLLWCVLNFSSIHCSAPIAYLGVKEKNACRSTKKGLKFKKFCIHFWSIIKAKFMRVYHWHSCGWERVATAPRNNKKNIVLWMHKLIFLAKFSIYRACGAYHSKISLW